MDLVVHAVAFEPGIMGRCGSGHAYPELSGTLRKDPGDNQMAVAFDCKASGSYGFQESQDTAGTLRGAGHGGGHSAIGIPDLSRCVTTGEGSRLDSESTTMILQAIGFLPQQKAESMSPMDNLSPCLVNGTNPGFQNGVSLPPYQVRRLTPVECARLQGFPDYHTRIPWRKRPADECPDGPQYKAYGNSMCTKVMRWIGNRLDPILRNPK